MIASKSFGATVLGLFIAFTGFVGALQIVNAAASRADFTLSASSSSRSVQQGNAVTYSINETKLNGFKDAVSLSASGLPAGATAIFSPQILDAKISSTLTVSTSGSTPTGSHSLTVRGTGGGVSRTVNVSLVVAAAPAQSFTVTSAAPSATMLPGETAAYSILTSAVNGFSGSVAFSLAGAPAGSTVSFSPATVAVGGSANLQVATKNNTPSGSYTLTVTGTSGGTSSTTSLQLSLSATGRSFAVSLPGSFAVPGPGAGIEALDLKMANPNNQALNITNLTVQIVSVTKAASAPAGKPCNAADYAVTQYAGSYPLVVPASQAATLSDLSVARSVWPTVRMVDAASNQDGCQGATVNLSFSGSGNG